MISTVFTAIMAFIATNIDDIFLLTLLFSSGVRKSSVYLGHFLGMMALTIVSFLGACGLSAFFDKYIFLLGIIPIILGVRAIFDKNDEQSGTNAGGMLGIMLLTIANGGDNVGIYLPMLVGMDFVGFAVTLAVFAAMSLLWCFIAGRLSSLPALKSFIGKYKRIIVPVVFIALGLMILTSGL